MIRISKHFYIETAKNCHLSSNVQLMLVVFLRSTDLLPLLLSPHMALCSRFAIATSKPTTDYAVVFYDRVELADIYLSVAPYLDRPRSRVALLLLIGS